MKIIKIYAENFGSYEKIDLELSNEGLVLLSGPTGSGKSTLCDVAPWVLFGKTAKNGAADEVLRWPGDQITYATVNMYLADGSTYGFVRTRGPTAKNNDLYWIKDCVWEYPQRGKDLPDTQRLINQLLGLDHSLYLSGAYYHEFSQTAQFFIAPAKIRRQICEHIVDLSLPKALHESLQTNRKEQTADLEVTNHRLAAASSGLSFLQTKYNSDFKRATDWDLYFENELLNLKSKADSFDQELEDRLQKLEISIDEFEFAREAQIKHLAVLGSEISIRRPASYKIQLEELDNQESELQTEEICYHCGAHKENVAITRIAEQRHAIKLQEIENNQKILDVDRFLRDEKEIAARVNPFVSALEQQMLATNVYLEQYKAFSQNKNPHRESLYDLSAEIQQTQEEQVRLQGISIGMKRDLEDIDVLVDVVADLRSVLIKNTIVGIEAKTNEFLTQFFDAEIRVSFDVQHADKVEVGITKDGNTAAYSQLSKGQRQILKLSFGIAVMLEVSNHHALDIDTVWMDEALDGLDDNFKTKAYSLFQSLPFTNIFVVEHSEAIKPLFNSRYDVMLVEGVSTIEKTC